MKRKLSLLLAASLLCVISCDSLLLDDPDILIPIRTMDDLDNIRNNLAGKYILLSDLDASGIDFEPIGTGPTIIDLFNNPFTGTFEGNGHTITNLSINRPDGWYVGLFGKISSTAHIKNIAIEGIEVNGSSYVGGLIGANEGGTIENCSTDITVTAGEYNAGGLVGINWGGSIKHCYAAGTITANRNNAGGLVGTNNKKPATEVWGTIENCFATGSVTTINSDNNTDARSGGLVGWNQNGIIEYCFATGTVTASDEYDDCYAGGLVGHNDSGIVKNSYARGETHGTADIDTSYSGGLVGGNLNGTIEKCYATGNVQADSSGGLIGIHYSGNIDDAGYYDSETTGQNDTGKGIPGSTAELQTISFYAGWDFSNIWNLQSSSYPILRNNILQ